MSISFNQYLSELKKIGSMKIYDTDTDVWDSGFADYAIGRFQCTMMDDYMLVKNVEVSQ